MIQFSIFLPVRNGLPYIKECVQGILDQSYPHFELVVLDNASTDSTIDWILGLDDPRIRLVKSKESLSIQESWARIKKEPKLEYMTMIGHDDVFAPNFLEIIQKLIVKYKDASLFQTGSCLINAHGKKIRSCQSVAEIETAAQYLEARFTFKRDVFGTGYVMRSNDYDTIGGIFNFEKLFFADDALWLSLIQKSYKVSDAREAFSVRIHPQSESASLPSAWSSILLGLNHFTCFLREFVEQDDLTRRAYDKFGSEFLLRYHQNIFIFALVEASQKGIKIEDEAISKIKSSLIKTKLVTTEEVEASLKIRALVFLNRGKLRRMVPILWGTYSFLKAKSYF